MGLCGIVSFQKHCDRQKANLRIRFKPSLFQHVGTHSSLAGKIQKLKVGTGCLSKPQMAFLPGLACTHPGAGWFWGGNIRDSNRWDSGGWISVQWLRFVLNYSELVELLLLRAAVMCTKSRCRLLSLGTGPGRPSECQTVVWV